MGVMASMQPYLAQYDLPEPSHAASHGALSAWQVPVSVQEIIAHVIAAGVSKLSCTLQDFHTKYLAATMAVVLIIGPFFAGHLRPSETTKGRASMLANMRYHTAVIISLFTALGSLASSSRKLMRLGAHAERILELEDTAKEINAGRPSVCTPCLVLALLNRP